MDCIFCKIINGEIPSRKVFEDDDFIAILDAFPANGGHTLVIPKKHYKNIFDMDESLIKEGYKIARDIAFVLKNSLNTEHINILQNNGELAGQSVEHFHIHIIPRREEDGVVIKSDVLQIEEDEMKSIQDIIKKGL